MRIVSIVAAVAVAVVNLHARAADDIDMARVLKELRTTTVSARVVISDPLTQYVAKLTEQEMNEYGCAYPVTEPQEVQALFDLLDAGQIAVAPPFYLFGPEPRFGIYLLGKDGSADKLLFTGTLLHPKPEHGTYNSTVHIQATNPNFAPELRAWAWERKPERGIACVPENFRP